MMVKLFLCSYFAAVSSFTPQFVGGDLKGKKLAFIPTASLFEEYTDYVDEAKEAFENLGLNIEVLDVSGAPKDLIERTLQSCDLIYVSGGNTFYLLQELEKSGAKTIILEQVKRQFGIKICLEKFQLPTLFNAHGQCLGLILEETICC